MRFFLNVASAIAMVPVLVYNWLFPVYVHVNVDKGTLRGFNSTTPNGTEYSTFNGIPYARPPVGELRFKAPEEEAAWAGVRDALKTGSVCPQLLFGTSGFYLGDEDCLYLNVYTPSLGDERLPVMLWIHPGAFYFGLPSALVYSPDFFVDSGVILVMINYRLGALGYLSTEDDAAPGNAASKDQVAALKWIQRNIAKFGGDPENVTIFGGSSGGVNVHHLLLSPMAKGLFAKAIGQSGSACNPWGLTINPAEVTVELAKAMGAKNLDGNKTKAFEFLKDAPCEDIVRSQISLITPEGRRKGILAPFVPTVDKDVKSEEVFLPALPEEILESGNFNKVPYITGHMSNEASFFEKEVTDPKSMTAAIEDTESFIPRDIRNKKLRKDLSKPIRELYFDDKPIGNENITNLIDLYTDFMFVIGTNRATRLQLKSSNAPVYYYVFSYKGGFNLFSDVATSLPGPVHADEIGYMFNIRALFWSKPAPGSEDQYMVNTMVRLWTNFAKFGNPTPPGDPYTWKPATLDTFNFLNISGRDTRPGVNPDKKRDDFWRRAYEKDAESRSSPLNLDLLDLM